MSSSIQNNPHPLSRGGISRSQRDLVALSPAHAPLDDRTDLELLEFFNQLSEVVIFHDLELRKSDWRDFFSGSLPFQLASISRFDTGVLETKFKDGLTEFEVGLEKGNLQTLFNRILEQAQIINRWYNSFTGAKGLKAEIGSLISEDLQFGLQRFLNLSSDAEKADLGVKRPANLLPFTTNQLWNISSSVRVGLSLPFLPGDNSLPRLRGTTARKKQIVLQQLKDLFQVFLEGIKRIVAVAPRFFSESMKKPENLTPHVGLIVAFLRLFKHVQGDMNKLTERQLEYYFRNVLGLEESPLVPDFAHLVLQLDKNVKRHKVPSGFQFMDGKDVNKADILFKLSEEVVLNQASVESFRTLYQKKNAGALESISIAQVANSKDGIGTPFEDPDAASWKTLGYHEAKDGTVLDKARIGFLIASPTLLLNEGDGNINVAVSLIFKNQPTDLNDLNSLNLNSLFKIFYTGKKGWEEATYTFSLSPSIPPLPAPNSFPATYQAVWNLSIQPDEIITFADPKVLKEDYGTTDPMLKFVLAETGIDAYRILLESNASIESIDLTVTANKVKKIIVQNDEGVQDANKPFMPFGAQPFVGSAFYVGCEEAFRKKLTDIQFHNSWAKLPVSFANHYLAYGAGVTDSGYFVFTAEVLDEMGIWKNLLLDSGTDLFSPLTIDFDLSNANPALPIISDPLLPLTPDTKAGFIKLTLTPKDFLHEEYLVKLQEALLTGAPATQGMKKKIQDEIDDVKNTGNTNADCDTELDGIKSFIENYVQAIPNVPYTPLLSEFYISYTAESIWNKANVENKETDITFLHLHPFEADNYDQPEFPAPATSVNFLPAFPNEGYLYIGLENLDPGSTISLLFQLAEATANPDVPKPQLTWEYLKDNEWGQLKPLSEILHDDTNDLVASGIVKLQIPFALSNKEMTILPNEYQWLRVTMPEYTDGVSEAVNIHAQGVKVVFDVQPENDTERLAVPLAAKKISKAPVNDPLVKKISQPYETFGGRPPESKQFFYRRASERLRHKGRAITLNDYERLVLSHFPEIFKVKCITHTNAGLAGNPDRYFAPGQVTLAVIPDITGLRFGEKLRPKASLALLCRIQDFLKKRNSCFVKVNVVNPIFQEINLKGNVVLRKDRDPIFYKNELDQDIMEFLTPWAFSEQDKLSFGGKVFRSSILQFVEKLDYVDFVTDFIMYSQKDTEGHPIPITVAEAKTERSVLAPGTIDITIDTGSGQPQNATLDDTDGLGFIPVGCIVVEGSAEEEPICNSGHDD